MRTAVVQIDIKPEKVVERWHQDDALVRYNEELIALSKKSFKAYADHVGADYILHEEAVWPQYHPQVEIFRNLDKLEEYDMVACFDIDMVANTKANIFDNVEMGKIGFVPRSQRETGGGYWDRRGGAVFNSGTVVFTKGMPDIWPYIDMDRTDKQEGRDQKELQVIIDKLGIGSPLSHKFNNYGEWGRDDPAVDLDSILHYKGGQKGSRYLKHREELLAKWN